MERRGRGDREASAVQRRDSRYFVCLSNALRTGGPRIILSGVMGMQMFVLPCHIGVLLFIFSSRKAKQGNRKGVRASQKGR